MLKEQQITSDQNINRRLFSDEEMDLYLWYDQQMKLIGFELIHNLKRHSLSFKWRVGQSSTYSRINSGDTKPGREGFDFFVTENDFPYTKWVQMFSKRSHNVDSEITELILLKMSEHKNQRPRTTLSDLKELLGRIFNRKSK